MAKTKDELITENTELLNARNLLEEGIDSLNKTINDLHNKLDAQDKIINTQALEIARLKEDKNKLRDYIVDQLKEYEKGIEDYKRYGIEDYTHGMAVGFKKCLEILGEKENEI